MAVRRKVNTGATLPAAPSGDGKGPFGNLTTLVERLPEKARPDVDVTVLSPPPQRPEPALPLVTVPVGKPLVAHHPAVTQPVHQPTVRVQMFTSLRVAVMDEAHGEAGPVASALRTLNAPTSVARTVEHLKALLKRDPFHTVFVMVPGDVTWVVELLEWGLQEHPSLHWVPVLLESRPARLKELRLAGAVEILEPPLPSAIGLLLRAAASAPMDLPPYITEAQDFLKELGLYWRSHEDAVAEYRSMLRERLARIEESRERMRRGVEKAVQKERAAVGAQADAQDLERNARALVMQLASMQQRAFRAEEEAAAATARLTEASDALRKERDVSSGRQETIDALTKAVQGASENASRALEAQTAELQRYHVRVQQLADSVLLTLMSLPRSAEVQRCVDLLQQMQAAAPPAGPPMVVGRLA